MAKSKASDRLKQLRKEEGFRMYCNANRKSMQVVGNHRYMSTEWKRRAEEALVDAWEKLPRVEREMWATSGNKTAREKKAAEVEANVHKQFGRYMEKHNLLAGVKGVRERNIQAAAIINEVLADPQKKAEVFPELKDLAAERAAAIRQGHAPVELPRSAPKPAARQEQAARAAPSRKQQARPGGGSNGGSGGKRGGGKRQRADYEGSDTEQSELSSGIEAEEESELSGGSGSEAASDRRRQLPSRGVRSQQLWQQVTQLPYTPAAAVQQRAAVLWKVDGSPEWCDATVLEFDCSNGQHLLVYDDDDEQEWHDLREEAVRWPASGVETAPGASWPVQRAAAGASAGMEQQAAAAQEDFDAGYYDVSYSAEGAEELYAEGPEVEQRAAIEAGPELAGVGAQLVAEQAATSAAAAPPELEVAQLQARLAAEQEALAAERAARTAAEDAACAAAGQHKEEVAQLQARLAAEQEARTAAEAAAAQCKAQLAQLQTQPATGQEALAASAAEAERLEGLPDQKEAQRADEAAAREAAGAEQAASAVDAVRLEGLPEQKEAQQAAAEAEAPVTGSGSKRKRKPGGASGSGSAARAKRMKQQPGEMIPPRPAWQGRQGSGSAVAATGVRRSDRDGKGKMSEDYFKIHGRYGAP